MLAHHLKLMQLEFKVEESESPAGAGNQIHVQYNSCDSWWLSGGHSSVMEHMQLKPGALIHDDCRPLTFLQLHLMTSNMSLLIISQLIPDQFSLPLNKEALVCSFWITRKFASNLHPAQTLGVRSYVCYVRMFSWLSELLKLTSSKVNGTKIIDPYCA